MGMGQGVMTGLGHGGSTCVLETQFSSFFFFFFFFQVRHIFLWKHFLLPLTQVGRQSVASRKMGT